jgi:hypothetical protein
MEVKAIAFSPWHLPSDVVSAVGHQVVTSFGLTELSPYDWSQLQEVRPHGCKDRCLNVYSSRYWFWVTSVFTIPDTGFG